MKSAFPQSVRSGHVAWPTCLLAACALGACSGSTTADASASPAAAAADAGAVMPPPPVPVGKYLEPQAARPKACELVTAAEMSAIIGKPATASGSEPFSNQTICNYRFGGMESVDFQVDWGDGEAAMAGIGMANRAEPGLAPAADDLGDGYARMGPTLMIRVGEDLVTLQMAGVDDTHATARRILEVARPRM